MSSLSLSGAPCRIPLTSFHIELFHFPTHVNLSFLRISVSLTSPAFPTLVLSSLLFSRPTFLFNKIAFICRSPSRIHTLSVRLSRDATSLALFCSFHNILLSNFCWFCPSPSFSLPRLSFFLSLSSLTSPHMSVSLFTFLGQNILVLVSTALRRFLASLFFHSSCPRRSYAHSRFCPARIRSEHSGYKFTLLPPFCSRLFLADMPLSPANSRVSLSRGHLFLANAGIPLIYLSPSPFYMHVILCPLLLSSSLLVGLILFPFSVVVRSP